MTTNTAQLAIFKAPGAPFEFAERPLPACGEGEALVAISLATICGSDLHTTAGRRKEPTPCVLGHEAVGRVVAVGPGRDPGLLGQRVTWTLADSCGECVPCRAWHLPQKCEHLFSLRPPMSIGHPSLQLPPSHKIGWGREACSSIDICLFFPYSCRNELSRFGQ